MHCSNLASSGGSRNFIRGAEGKKIEKLNTIANITELNLNLLNTDDLYIQIVTNTMKIKIKATCWTAGA